MRVAVLLVLGSALGACGRISFAVPGDGLTGDDARNDGEVNAGRCGDPTVVPSPLHWTGQTFTYSGFMGQTDPQPKCFVEVKSRTSTEVFASVMEPVSSSDFFLDIPTMGEPLDAVLRLSRMDLWTTLVWLDRPLATDLVGQTQMWEPGTGSMWGDAQMGVVYANAEGGVGVDLTRGTITFVVRDCAGTPVAGAAIKLTPAAPLLRYLKDDGSINTDISSTQGVYGAAVALNVDAGHVLIETTAPGLSFDPVEIDVSSGKATDVVVLRGY